MTCILSLLHWNMSFEKKVRFKRRAKKCLFHAKRPVLHNVLWVINEKYFFLSFSLYFFLFSNAIMDLKAFRTKKTWLPLTLINNLVFWYFFCSSVAFWKTSNRKKNIQRVQFFPTLGTSSRQNIQRGIRCSCKDKRKTMVIKCVCERERSDFFSHLPPFCLKRFKSLECRIS